MVASVGALGSGIAAWKALSSEGRPRDTMLRHIKNAAVAFLPGVNLAGRDSGQRVSGRFGDPIPPNRP